jgi:pyridoxamine 5'-phosphate oxidase
MRGMLPPDSPVAGPRLEALDLDPDPIVQFQRWFAGAVERALPQPEAAALATASADGRPSVRMVLVKGVDARGFRFFTHADSRKGRELAANPRAALAFHWHALGRQVRVEGAAAPIPAEESDAYFATRPEGSRYSAAASPQSRVIRDRAELEREVARLRARYPGGDLPRPERWHGYRLVPDAVEFWQQGLDRLHDRLRYRREGAGWVIERLAP